MAIVVSSNWAAVQTTGAGSLSTGAHTPNAGECIIAAVATNRRVLAVTDGGVSQVPYRLLGPYGPSASGNSIWLAYLPGIYVAATSRSLVATFSASGSGAIAALAVAGLASRYPFDAAQSAIGGGTAMDSGALNTNTRYPNSILIGVGGNGTGSTTTWTAGSGYTQPVGPTVGTGSSGLTLEMEYQIVSAIGTYNATMTSSVSSNFTAVVAVFADTDVPGASWVDRSSYPHPGRSPGLAPVSGRFWQFPVAITPAVPSTNNGNAALTQAAQTLSAAGTVKVAGALAKTQAAQTLAAAGSIRVTGALAKTQDAQTLHATGTVTQPSVTPPPVVGTGEGAYFPPVRRRRPLQPAVGRAALYQDDQQLLATGTVRSYAKQTGQALKASGRALIAGHGSTGNAAGKCCAAGTVLIKGRARLRNRAAWLTGRGKVSTCGRAELKASDARAHGAGKVDWSGAIAREDDALARGSWMIDLFDDD